MLSIPRLAATMKSLLIDDAKESARESRYEQRKAKKLPGDKFVETMVFGAMSAPVLTLPRLTRTAAALGVQISPQGLEQRCTAKAADCLLGVLQRATERSFAGEKVAIELLQRFSAVEVDDSSSVSLPA